MAAISNEQLAYLSDNIDLVGEYVKIVFGNPNVSKDNPFSCVTVNQYTSRHDCVIVHTNISSHSMDHCGCYWPELLQYVEDNDNSPPVFK